MCYHSDWLAERVGELRRCGTDGLPKCFVGPATVVTNCAYRFREVFVYCYTVWFSCGRSATILTYPSLIFRFLGRVQMYECLPLSQASIVASNSLCSSIRFARFAIKIPRSVPGKCFHESCFNAAFAACTALSTSSAPAAWTSAILDSVLIRYQFFYQLSN